MYRDLNDYELLYMVCDESNSFKTLMEKYQPLIYKVVKDYRKYFKKFGYEIEDLMQIGYITLYSSSTQYDIYDDTMFYTYFKRSLNNAMVNILRQNLTNKKEVLNNAFSYNLEIPYTNLTYIDLFMDNKKVYDYSSELTIFKNSMPYLFSAIFELFYNGYTKEEISVLLDERVDYIKKIFIQIKKHALTYKCLFFE